jgi:hypothetical protein
MPIAAIPIQIRRISIRKNSDASGRIPADVRRESCCGQMSYDICYGYGNIDISG